MDNQLQITNAESAYVLGLLWADGYFGGKHKNKYHDKFYSIGIRISKDDLELTKHIFEKSIFNEWNKWKFYDYKNKNKSYKILLEAQLHSIDLCDIFLSFNFDKKSYISHEFVFNVIPENLHKYFIRGFIDGDGCFYIRKNKNGQSFSISSSVNQDWQFLQQYIYEKIKIDSKIIKSKNKKGKGSSLVIDKKNDIVKLGDYIYDGFNVDKIGFPRKHDKFFIIKQSFEEAPKYSLYNKAYKNVFLKNINTNEVVEIIKMKDFCTKHCLDSFGIRNVLSGKYIQWKGWTLPEMDYENLKKIKYENFANKISKTYEFTYKGEKIIIKNLYRFCKDSNLNYSSFKALMRGKIKSYKNYQFIKKV